MHRVRPCSKSTKVSLPQIFSRNSSRVTRWPGREASSTRILAACGRSRTERPDLRSSPVSTSSSKIQKRRGGLMRGVLDTQTPKLSAHYTPRKARILKSVSTYVFTDFDPYPKLILRELTAIRFGRSVGARRAHKTRR